MSYPKHDIQATSDAVVALLTNELRPLHYREAYLRCAVLNPKLGFYSNKTDPAEKLRQLFAETSREIFVCDGFFYLYEWLTECQDLLFRNTIAADRLTQIQRDKCFYDSGRRHDYMVDKYGKANTPHGIEERQRRALIEYSVKAYFQRQFPTLFLPPSNENQFTQWSEDDFRLQFGNTLSAFDVKEFTRTNRTILTSVKQHITYIFAVWNYDHADMIGFIRGQDAINLTELELSRVNRIVKSVGIDDISNIASLLVAVNMYKFGLLFTEVKSEFYRKQSVAA
ncbi:hypothetical protein HUU62_08730 [Rhodoferax sp. 4810]|uniref:Uncharacterized protein n=1 Tax=Thiospirillum jenense TaxID=1653858 RepID=A0A839HGY5_9GAMM|nr:hypothetical protein [Thiospirillum jenense]MBB1074494.1 hypothetical protein [Rhodoferax jenense]MBB1125522.1 hypothetical protein [Thiospirillum jenense]